MAFNWSHEFKRVVLRRVVYTVVALAIAYMGLWPSKASAQVPVQANCSGAGSMNVCSSKSDAVLWAKAIATDYCNNQGYNIVCLNAFYAQIDSPRPNDPFAGSLVYNTQLKLGNDTFYRQSSPYVYYCGPGRYWNGSVCAMQPTCTGEKTWNGSACVCPAGETEGPNDTCRGCADLNAEPGSPATRGNISRPFQSRCIGGCTLAMTGGSGYCVTVGTAGGGTSCSGHFEYSGASCSVDPQLPPFVPPAEPKDEPEETCMPAGGGQTMCIRKDGKHCYNSTVGGSHCWTPGETGQKGSNDKLQVRGPGTSTPSPKSPQTSKGDPYTPTTPPITTTTSTPQNTVTTTTQNYKTENGTNADDQKPGGPNEGDDDGDENSASGGGDCQAPPIVSGDAILGMVANQAWATRCAVEAGNAASVTGDVGDCKSAFVVAGDDANAVKLRAMRAEICGENQPGWTKGDAPATPGEGDGEDGTGHTKFGLGIGAGMLDTSDMIGGGSCTNFTMTIYNQSFSTAEMPYWCNALAILRALILIFAAYTAVRLLTGGTA